VSSGLFPYYSFSKFNVSGLLKGESGTVLVVSGREEFRKTGGVGTLPKKDA
jgi:hypothetical protein